jgi:hypothetical protein
MMQDDIGNKFFAVRSEGFRVAEVNKIFSGYQPYKLVKNW